MSARVYVLLNVSEGNSIRAVEILENQKGVIIADMLEGPPDIVLAIEASSKRQLAERVIRAMVSVESMLEDVKLLPAIPVSGAGAGKRRNTVKQVPSMAA